MGSICGRVRGRVISICGHLPFLQAAGGRLFSWQLPARCVAAQVHPSLSLSPSLWVSFVFFLLYFIVFLSEISRAGF